MSGILEGRLNGSPEDTEPSMQEEEVSRKEKDSWMQSRVSSNKKGKRKKQEYDAEPSFHASAKGEDPDGYVPLTDEDIRELQQLEDMASRESFLKSERNRKRRKKAASIAMSAACVYMIMLIYGAITTEFKYDSNGDIVPVVLSVDEIATKNDYSYVAGYYLQARALYEQILVLDYRMAAGVEDPMKVAVEYDSALYDILALLSQLEGAYVPPVYNQLVAMLSTWLDQPLRSYCQHVRDAFTLNDANEEQEAIAAREVVNANFKLITKNIMALGEDVSGYDLTEISEWSPTGYIEQAVEGGV